MKQHDQPVREFLENMRQKAEKMNTYPELMSEIFPEMKINSRHLPVEASYDLNANNKYKKEMYKIVEGIDSTGTG